VREDAVAKYQVNSTPTIIVNGKKLEGTDMAAIESAIAAAE
jgi:protein-disulfide isomerase